MIRFDSDAKRADYSKMVRFDKFPSPASELGKCLKENPKLLISESEGVSSVIAIVIGSGCLHSADRILLENKHFLPGADPFYCGKGNVYMSHLLTSAGLNMYLALMALRFYPHNFLIEQGGNNNHLQVKKTHYDCLYWENEAGEQLPAVFEGYELDHVQNYTTRIAPAFMLKAYAIYQLEVRVAKTSDDLEKKKIQTALGDCYLQIAAIENSCRHAYYYFLDTALECYREVSPQYRTMQIAQVEGMIADREQGFERQQEASVEIDLINDSPRNSDETRSMSTDSGGSLHYRGNNANLQFTTPQKPLNSEERPLNKTKYS